MLDRAIVALKADQSKALAASTMRTTRFPRPRSFVDGFHTADGNFTADEVVLSAPISASSSFTTSSMGQRSDDVVDDAPEGTVLAAIDYQMPKPGETKPSAKEALETRVGDQACGVSYFK